jgi:hypothetical protein
VILALDSAKGSSNCVVVDTLLAFENEAVCAYVWTCDADVIAVVRLSTQAERKRKDEQVRETIMQRLVESGEKERYGKPVALQ